MKTDKFVSVIAPLYNDAKLIPGFVKDVTEVLGNNFTNYELVLVDDYSRDDTVTQVTALLNQYEGVRLIRLSREFGEEIAITAGLDTVIGDFTIVMHPATDPVEKIPELVRQCSQGLDVIYGVRNTPDEKSWLSRKATSWFFWYCRKVLKFELTENATIFGCLSRQAVNAIIRIKDSYRYFRLLTTLIGYEQKPFYYDAIHRGESSRPHSFLKSLAEALRVIMEYSVHPLRLACWLGIIAAISNLVYIAYIFAVYFFKEDIMQGWTTLSLQNAAQFFFIAVILTVISEYTGRILNRLRNRPLYYQREEKNSSLMLIDRERRNIVEESKSTDLQQ